MLKQRLDCQTDASFARKPNPRTRSLLISSLLLSDGAYVFDFRPKGLFAVETDQSRATTKWRHSHRVTNPFSRAFWLFFKMAIAQQKAGHVS